MKLPGIEITATRLNEACELFLKYLEGDGVADATIRSYKSVLKKLRTACGNIFLHEITPDHLAAIMAEHTRRGNGQGVRNSNVSCLRQFFRWARLTKRTSPYESEDPTNMLKRKAYEAAQPPPIPHTHFPILLDIAERRHPMYRAYVALGLYTAARGPSELGPLRLWDIVTTGSEWSVSIERVKTYSAAEPVPMVNELSIEITKWLTWYNAYTIEHLGVPLQREWYLLPRIKGVKARGSKYNDGQNEMRIYPNIRKHPSGMSRDITYPVLKEYGFPVDDQAGRKNRFGGTHTLRKSGARAFYRELMDTGVARDRALDVIKELLGHKYVSTTEVYLGLDRGREFRDELMRGKWMFRSNDPASVDISQNPTEDRESAIAALPAFLRSA